MDFYRHDQSGRLPVAAESSQDESVADFRQRNARRPSYSRKSELTVLPPDYVTPGIESSRHLSECRLSPCAWTPEESPATQRVSSYRRSYDSLNNLANPTVDTGGHADLIIADWLGLSSDDDRGSFARNRPRNSTAPERCAPVTPPGLPLSDPSTRSRPTKTNKALPAGSKAMATFPRARSAASGSESESSNARVRNMRKVCISDDDEFIPPPAYLPKPTRSQRRPVLPEEPAVNSSAAGYPNTTDVGGFAGRNSRHTHFNSFDVSNTADAQLGPMHRRNKSVGGRPQYSGGPRSARLGPSASFSSAGDLRLQPASSSSRYLPPPSASADIPLQDYRPSNRMHSSSSHGFSGRSRVVASEGEEDFDYGGRGRFEPSEEEKGYKRVTTLMKGLIEQWSQE